MLSADVDRAAPTNQGRIGELYLRHADAAVRLAYLLTGDLPLAEDLAQDAFVRLAGRLTHLRDPDAFDAYLRRTIVNLSRSHFRRKRVERTYLARERNAPPRAAGAAWSQQRVEDRDEFWETLRRLPERQRAAIVLRYYEDLSESRVADILRCRPGTVKSLVSRGLQTLRTEIRGDER